MFEFLFCAVFFFVWYWISLHPGSWLGFVFTPSDLGAAIRQLDERKLQTKKKLRTAGQKSLVFWCALVGIGTSAGVSDGNYSFHDAASGFAGGLVTGLVMAYAVLHWSTRDGGWYGLD
ncbi:hypothetical protein [Luteimonas deserti]|uniref:Uncharacterized protein n=1 Tax=Luteimonas deserti TaxID=2752306 RepID=A0A7Z0QPZ7_9GAMM|nr:hypothetical protein [Luteimonas deserti]NYZ62578.1 hypothetical protein [Luteimonas deserti]